MIKCKDYSHIIQESGSDRLKKNDESPIRENCQVRVRWQNVSESKKRKLQKETDSDREMRNLLYRKQKQGTNILEKEDNSRH